MNCQSRFLNSSSKILCLTSSIIATGILLNWELLVLKGSKSNRSVVPMRSDIRRGHATYLDGEVSLPPQKKWADADSKMLLQLRSYKHKNSSSPEEIATEWSQNETAVIVVDLWDNHWCRSSLEQIRELVPRVEKFLTVVRNSGVLVIHAPTNVHDFYRRYLQRKRVIDMKETYLKDKKIIKFPSRKHYRPSESQPLYMGKEQGCLDVPTPAQKLIWKRQATGITIAKDDLILRNDRQER